MIMQVHDELVFEVSDAQVSKLQEHVMDIMQNIAELQVPLVVDAASGGNWSLAH